MGSSMMQEKMCRDAEHHETILETEYEIFRLQEDQKLREEAKGKNREHRDGERLRSYRMVQMLNLGVMGQRLNDINIISEDIGT